MQGKAARCALTMQEQPLLSLKMNYLRRKANCRNPTITQRNWYSQNQWETKETELERSEFQCFRASCITLDEPIYAICTSQVKKDKAS